MPRRVFCSEADGAPAASADDIQALAQRLIDDRALAERLAASSEMPALLRAASEKDTKDSEGVSKEDSVKSRLWSDQPMPTTRQMKIYSTQHFVPFVGFGFCDNFIMILAGDYIDGHLGIALGVSTMFAAGIGNTLSDICGLWLSGVIETAGAAMGLPRSGLTLEQRTDMRMMALRNISMISGMVLGCILGMCPLLYPEEWRMWPNRAQLLLEMQQKEDNDKEQSS